MKKYWGLLIVVTTVAAVSAIIRFAPQKTIVVERDSKITTYDTVKIISTPDGKNFKARNIELNRASGEELEKVYGIGKVFSSRIVEYRDALGGFYSKEQLKEVKGITDEIFHNLESNFSVDPLVIRKINLNFATQEQLRRHPYITPSMAGRIAGGVEMKGGYDTLEQLLDDNILLPKEARKIAPYVVFSTKK